LLINTQLRYYLHIDDPDALSDDDWASSWQALQWIREQEAKRQKAIHG
jgi:hypothetical protein